jgi:hypothetical protein
LTSTKFNRRKYLDKFFNTDFFEYIVETTVETELMLQGLTCLMKLDVSNPIFNDFLSKICEMHGIKFHEHKVIQSLIEVYLSDSSDVYIKALDSLGLSEYSDLFLIGKGSILLKYTPINFFYP